MKPVSRRIPLMSRVLLIILTGLLLVAPLKGDEPGPVSFKRAYLLHLPGVGGELSIDRDLINGLKAGGYTGQTAIYDWTESSPGLAALLSRERNMKEAQHIADKIAQIVKDDPAVRITLTAHSGGNGLAVWALEKLPDDVRVQTLFLLSSALSPEYDLSRALRHVSGKAYAFSSEFDSIVLGAGTRVFGTIDGVRCEASGKVGFAIPKDGDALEYAKLVQFPFDRAWMKYGNLGDHIGTLRPAFAQHVLAPLVLSDLGADTTQPATSRPSDGN